MPQELEKVPYFERAMTDPTLLLTDDSKHLITGSGDNTTKIWDVSNGKLIHNLKHRYERRTRRNRTGSGGLCIGFSAFILSDLN